MHTFDYSTTPSNLLTPEIVKLLTCLHEFRGKQTLYMQSQPEVLTALLDVAKIQSTKASNSIEGIYTSDERIEALVMQRSAPRNRSEEEIAGYREVLNTIHESYEFISVSPNTILKLHRDLYTYSSSDLGGHFKNADNVIAEKANDGHERIRFIPVPAFQTPQAVDELCQAFNAAIVRDEFDPLLLIPMFILDFLCIHPFNDGNGRMSRLLTLLLLYRSGYIVGKYISLEMQTEQSKATYYEALQASSAAWHESANDYLPFIHYTLGVILRAYKEFQQRVEHLSIRRLSKPERIRAIFERRLTPMRKTDIAAICPDISITTIERTLLALTREGYLHKVGNGPATAYIRVL